jgi:hypothetical protein
MKVAEMRFLRKTTKHTLFHHIKKYGLKELKIQVVLIQITGYNNKWIRQVSRMDRSRPQQAVMKYQPAGKRNTGRQRKRDFWIVTLRLERAT